MEESIFYKRIKKLANELGKSFNQIEKELGYSRNALSNYKTQTIPSAIRLLELAEYFDVTPRYFWEWIVFTQKNRKKQILLSSFLKILIKIKKLKYVSFRKFGCCKS